MECMEDFYKHFVSAFELFTEKRYLDSLQKLTDAQNITGISKSTDLTVSLENLKGFNYLALNYTEYARECFEKSLSLDNTSSQACAGLAEIFFVEQQDKEAKTMYEWAVKNNPDNLFAVNGLSKVNETLGFPEEHNSLNEEVIEKVNETIREKIHNAGSLFESGRYSETVKNINSIEKTIELEIQEQQELLAEMLNMKGTALLRLDETEAAKENFEKALNLNPESSNACRGLADIFYNGENYNEAKTMYEWALKNNIDNKAAQEGLAKTNKLLNLPEEDNTLLEEDSRNLQTIVDETLVNAYEMFQNKEYENSLKLLTEIENCAIDNETDNLPDVLSSIKNFKGFNFLALNEVDAARSSFEKALNLNPSSSQACAGLAEILFIEGKDNESKTMFEWSVKNDPENLFGRAGLEKLNKLLNFSPDHNTLMGSSVLTLSSGRTLSFKGE